VAHQTFLWQDGFRPITVPDLERVMILRVLLAVTCIISLSGCGGKDRSDTAQSSVRPLIGVSLLTLENPFFRVIGDTIKKEADLQGFDVVVVSADKDPARQANQMQDFLVKKARAIVISPCESKAMVPAIQEANKAGVPVFTVDIPCREEGVKIVCQVATDNLGGGREAGRGMIEALGPSGGSVVILHFKQAESCRLRVQGFREVIEAHNAKSASKVAIVAELEGGAARDLSYKATEDALQAHAGVRGIFAINDPSALGACAALEKAGKDKSVKVIGFDGQPEGIEAIAQGKIYADPVQFPDQMGREIVKAIVAHSRGETVVSEILIPTSLKRQVDVQVDVLRDKVADLTKETNALIEQRTGKKK
jgi:ribose transport system substrate-binding protein